MSDYASVADEANRALASVARLEAAVMRDPSSRALRMNLAAKQKFANQLRERLLEIAQESQVEICNYRLISSTQKPFLMSYVSESMLGYQHLFTQIHDARRNGPKATTRVPAESFNESMLEIGYTYSGSLGIVLMAPSKRDFFEGLLDASIDAFFNVIDVSTRPALLEVARQYGNAVVKRMHDWSAANVKAGFDADVRWSRSDGRQLGQLVDRVRMERIVGLIQATSESVTEPQEVVGTLVGIDMKAGSFHLVVPDGESYRGSLASAFDRNRTVLVNRRYRASLIETRTTIYATETERKEYTLVFLNDAPANRPGQPGAVT